MATWQRYSRTLAPLSSSPVSFLRSPFLLSALFPFGSPRRPVRRMAASSNNYASSSRTDLSSLPSNDEHADASSTYGTFPQTGSSTGRSRASRHEPSLYTSSAATLVNENDTLLRGRPKQRYTSGLSLNHPPKLEKVDEHPPNILDPLNPQLFLENAGCVVRDHLASERTFLSYVRTSLAISMTGIGECSCIISPYLPFRQRRAVFIQLLSISPPDAPSLGNGHEGLGRPTKLARPLAVYTILTGILTLIVGVSVTSHHDSAKHSPDRTYPILRRHAIFHRSDDAHQWII